jgi:2-isopropylmalate synthase
MRPQDVGWQQSQMVLGRHSGRAALADRLDALGLDVDEASLDVVFAGFKALAEKKREIFDADLEALVLGSDAAASRGYRLARWHVSTGVGADSLPTASVRVIDSDGRVVDEAAVGDGPVHALFAALARATALALEIDSYHVSSVTTGDDAQGQASLTARVDGVEFTGSGTSTDIVEASAHAWLEVANRAVRARAPRPVAALA